MSLTRKHAALWFALLVVVAFAAYRGGFDNPFVYDDHHAILENEFIQDARHLKRFLAGEVASTGAFRGHFRPVAMASLYLNYRAGGLDPWGYRLVNLVLHLLCALLAYLVVRRLLLGFAFGPRLKLGEAEARLGALVAAGLLALHPVHSLAVLLVWKRTTLFAALFFLVAVHAFLRVRGVGGPAPTGSAARAVHWATVLVAFALALASKETAITLPAVLLLVEIAIPGPWTAERAGRTALLQAPLWIGVVLSLTVFFPENIASAADVDRFSYLLVQAKVIWMYVGMAFAPNLLAGAYEVGVPASVSDPAALAGGLGILLLLGAAILSLRRYPLPALAVLWALFTLSPTSSFVPNPLLVDEDRVYLPFLVPWALGGGALARAWAGARARRLAAAAVAALVLGGAAFATAARSITWNDGLWIWLDALEKYPNATAARLNLCTTLSGILERAREAVPACRDAIAAVPRSSLARSALVRALASLGHFAQAELEVDAGLRIAPGNPYLLKVAGHLAWANDEPRKAIPLYLRALRANPWDIESLLYLAKSHREIGRDEEARRALRYIEGRPLVDSSSRVLLADLYRELGELEKAEQVLRPLRSEHPGEPGAAISLALVALARGERDRAAPLLAEAERLAQGHPALLMRIARAELRRGDATRAATLFERVVAARPRALLARAELARAWLAAGRRGEACGLARGLRGEAGADPSAARVLASVERKCGRVETKPGVP